MRQFNRDEDSVYARAAFDSPANQKSRSNKKRQAIIDTWQQPVWPKLTRILFVSMIVLSAAMALVELKNALIAPAFDVRHFLVNLSTTLLWVWGVHALLLTAACAAGAHVNRTGYERRKAESGISDITDDDKARSKRAVARLNHTYSVYMRVSLIGFAVVAVLYVLARAI